MLTDECLLLRGTDLRGLSIDIKALLKSISIIILAICKNKMHWSMMEYEK